MAESVFGRVQRVFSAGVESATEAMERASGPALMRHAILELDQSAENLRGAINAARARGVEAERREKSARAQIATLDEQARFALGKDREDLAEAAVARQVELEARIAGFQQARREAAAEAAALEARLPDLEARKTRMQKEFATFQSARRASASATCGLSPSAGMSPSDRAERKAARAEGAFERAMSAAGGVDVGPAAAGGEARLAEVERLRRDAAIAERLAAMREGGTATKKRAARARA